MDHYEQRRKKLSGDMDWWADEDGHHGDSLAQDMMEINKKMLLETQDSIDEKTEESDD